MEDKVYGVQRIEGRQNSGRQHHAARAEDPDRDKPRKHDRAENLADEAGSSALNEEKYDQNGESERNDYWSQSGSVHFQAFDRAQH
jgi:hypothetical protein